LEKGVDMNRFALVLVCSIVGMVGIAVRSQAPDPEAAYKFQAIQPGIYSAVGTGTLNVGSISAVIVDQDDVVIVDSHITPEAARVMLRELKALTDKPVRTLINTHFHFDHVDGNQVFAPDVDIVGHEFTRKKLAGDFLHEPIFVNSVAGIPRQIADLESRAERETDPAAKARLGQQLRVMREYQTQIKEVKPTPPNVTLDDRLTLFRGGREIRVMFLGHGHTGGDLVVYLPKERVLCSGDLLVNGIANLVDGYVNEWPDALEKLKPLDFDDVIPGHGEPFKGKERIGYFQDYLRDLWQQATRLHDQHVTAEDAAKRIDMTAYKGHFPTIAGPGVNPVAVARMYSVMEGSADR
jgi:cyclase